MDRRWYNGRQEAGIRDKQHYDKEQVAHSSVYSLCLSWMDMYIVWFIQVALVR